MGNSNTVISNSTTNENIPLIKPSYNQSLYLRKMTKLEILKIISDMRRDSSPGKDGISINIIKRIKEHIADILVNIFNTILVESSIPKPFKIAIITPIHK